MLYGRHYLKKNQMASDQGHHRSQPLNDVWVTYCILLHDKVHNHTHIVQSSSMLLFSCNQSDSKHYRQVNCHSVVALFCEWWPTTATRLANRVLKVMKLAIWSDRPHKTTQRTIWTKVCDCKEHLHQVFSTQNSPLSNLCSETWFC